MVRNSEFNFAVATEYDRGVRRTLPTYDALFQLTQAYFRNVLRTEASILVVGAGGGNELLTFGPDNPAWHFTAVDPAKSMLDLAKLKATQSKLLQRVTFIEGTVQDLPAHQLFDAATCLLVLHFIQDAQQRKALLSSICQRLVDGAPFIFAAMYKDKITSIFETQLFLWKSYWLDKTSLTIVEVEEMEKDIRALPLQTEEELNELLIEAGFDQITKFFQTNMFGGWLCTARS